MTKHEHEWYPLAYHESEGDSEEEVALWACSGRTDKGACLATADADTIRTESRRQHVFEAEAEAEREQRHWNWED